MATAAQKKADEALQRKLSEKLKEEVEQHNNLEQEKNNYLQAAQGIAARQMRSAARCELLEEQLADLGGIHPEVLDQLPQEPVGDATD
jgi:hypothetical protein